jgi:hypothetical protein
MDPGGDLFYCEHWRCRLTPRACAARHRNARRGAVTYGVLSAEPPGCHDTYCRDCEIGAENARKEPDMRPKKTPPVSYHNDPVENMRVPKDHHLRLLLGEKLAGNVMRRAAAQKMDAAEHLRQIVAEYMYLESLGA